MKKLILFSGIQPSGDLNIGHYISVISKWEKIQKFYKCFFCIADLHSIINNKKKFLINKNILDILSIFLSSGIDPLINSIFVQSKVEEHLKLFWILSSFIKYGQIKRMHKFKNNIKYKIDSDISLILYPILMASDILLYDTDIVSVGIDQNQHLELVKNISLKFNKVYGNFFKIPKKFYVENESSIMSLLNPNKKMSKSDINKNNYISLLDDKLTLKKKIEKSLTDSDFPPLIKYDTIKKPGISNLLNIASGLDNVSINKLEEEFINKNYSEFKKYIINIIFKKLNNIQNNFYKIRNNESYLNKILLNGYKKSKIVAEEKFNKIKDLFYNK